MFSGAAASPCSPLHVWRSQLTPDFFKAATPHRTWNTMLLTFRWLLSSTIQHVHFSFYEAISFPMGVTEITIPFPIVKPINSFMINALPAPSTKLRWFQNKTLKERKIMVNSQNYNNFHLLNILSQMNHFICCSHFLPSLIS